MGIDKETGTTAAAKLRLHAEERLAATTAAMPAMPGSETSQGPVHEVELHQIELEMQNSELLRSQDLLEAQQIELEVQNEELHRVQEQLEAQQLELELQNDELQRAQEQLEGQQIELELQNEELRGTREELEISRNKFAELYDFAPVGYFTFDARGLIQEMNLAGAQLLGGDRRTLTAKRFDSFIVDPKDRVLFAAHLTGVLQGEEMQSFEVRLAGKDGALIYGQLQSVRVAAVDDKDGYVLCSIVDGTVAKKLAAEVQEALEYSESIVETVRKPLVVLSPELKILTANHSFYETFQVSPEETLGKFIYDLGNRQWDIPKLRVLFEDILPNESVFNGYEVDHVFLDIGRKVILLNAREILRENIGSHIILLAMEDITARREAEEALLKAGALQNAIFNSANFSSIATDARGVIQIFNVGAERMLGYTAAEVTNRITPADISDPQEVIARAKELSVELDTPITPGFEALIFKASRGIEDIYELTYIRKDGSRFPAVVSVTALRDEGGAIIGYLLIGTDNTARKVAEEALLKAGALQSAIFNSANFSSIATDAQGVIQIFNVGAERMLGYTAAEVMNTITPADISDPSEVIARAKELSVELGTEITPGFEALVFKASRGIEDIYELTYIRKDGSRFPAVVSVTALRDEGGAIIGYLLIGTDNTARKVAEEALLKAGALQSAIFNSANFSSIATDAKGVIQIFNVGAERMLGYTAAEIMNTITPADISDPSEVVARAKALSVELGTEITPGFEALVFKASRGIEDIYELTYIRKDGSRFPAVVSVTALRDEDDAIIGYLLIGTDNTARKQIEAEQAQLSQRLRDHQFYTRSLFEANIDASMTSDPSGIITDVNKQMEVLTGCTRDELIGAPFKNYFTDPERAEAGIKLVLGEKKLNDYELTARARDGVETVVSCNATTFYDRDRKLQGVFAAARDVTERKRLDQVLQEKNIELEGARAVAEKTSLTKSDFLANMSHELRTPLNSVIGFSEVLQDQLFGPINPKQQEYVGNIITSGRHLLSLINDILDLSKVESGKMGLDLNSFPLRESLEASMNILRERALKAGLEFRMEIDPEAEVLIMADQRKLKQILFNLLSNAVKFTPSAGSVLLSARRDGEFIEITVTDSGIGIRQEDIPKLFQAFTQLESVYTKGFEGTGLGLALTRQLVEMHGGRIWVKSEFDAGSSFSFTLPISQAAGRVPDAGQPEAVPGAGNNTVLVIEDDPLTLAALEATLQRKGYRALRASNGLDGVEMAQRNSPDLIVLDLVMPGLNGFDVADRLRQDNPAADVPILVLTSMDLSAADRARLAGKVWRIEGKGSLSTHEFLSLVESVVGQGETMGPG